MTTTEGETLIKAYDLPFQKSATFKDVTLFGGMKVLRMTFRERKRFTMIDLDPAAARMLANDLLDWAKDNE